MLEVLRYAVFASLWVLAGGLVGAPVEIVVDEPVAESLEGAQSDEIASQAVEAMPIQDRGVIYSEVAGLKVAEKTLHNGMKLVAIRQPAAPKVNVELVFRGVGSTIEAPGEKGLAHLVEHLIFKGTKASNPQDSLSESSYSTLCQKYAASCNAFTSFDTTAYYILGDANNWKPFLKLYAQCMQYAAFDPEHLASEVKVVIMELRRGRDNVISRLHEEFIRTMVPLEHPHHGVVIGYKEDLANVTAQKIKTFFDTYYRASTATLFMMGDLDIDDALASAEAEFNVLPAVKVELPQPFEKNYDLNIGFQKVIYDDRTTEAVLMGWPAPAGLSDETYQTDVLVSLLSGENGILIKRLVHDEKCAFAVGCEFERDNGMSYFFVQCYPHEGQKEKCVALIHEELAKIVNAGVEADALVRAINMERLGHAHKLEGLANSRYGFDPAWVMRYVASGKLEDGFNHIERFAAVTSEQIQKLVAAYFSQEKVSRVDLVPLPESERENRAKELQYEQEVEAKILAAHVRTTPVAECVLPMGYPEPSPIAVTFPKAEIHTTLENGLSLVASRDTSSKLCTFVLEHRDREHIAGTLDGAVLEILGKMLMQGSADATREEILNWFEMHGINVAVDGISWSLVGLSENFVPALNYLFEIVLSVNFSELELEKIKERTIATLQHAKDESSSLLIRASMQRLYPETSRDWSFDDAVRRIQSLDVATLRAYMERYLDPQAMVASVVGNVDMHEAMVALAIATKAWRGQGYRAEPFVATRPLMEHFDVPVVRDQVWMLYARQAPFSWDHPDYPALRVASEVVQGGMGCRLFSIRERTGLCYVLQGIFGKGTGQLPGQDWVISQTGPEKLLPLQAEIENFIAQGMLDPITAEELAAAKATVRAAFAASLSTTQGKAAYFANLECRNASETFYEDFLRSVDALTAQDVENALARYLAAGPYVRIQVGNVT